jgi:peptidoglycan/LPS O-acetylase OafA/YrhL
VLCLVEFAICVSWLDAMLYYYGLVIVELLTAVLILDVCINPRSLVRKFLGMKWLVWTGTISYGLYLWHAIVYGTIDGFGFDARAVFFVGTPLTFLIAALSYYAMEKPIRMLKRRYAS